MTQKTTSFNVTRHRNCVMQPERFERRDEKYHMFAKRSFERAKDAEMALHLRFDKAA